ncbi:unnamed protein product, partial [marine sediment metagenome]
TVTLKFKNRDLAFIKRVIYKKRGGCHRFKIIEEEN